MLASVILLSKQLVDDRKYVDLDYDQIISQQTALTKRLVCNTPRFASNNIQLFTKICAIIHDTNPTIEAKTPSNSASAILAPVPSMPPPKIQEQKTVAEIIPGGPSPPANIFNSFVYPVLTPPVLTPPSPVLTPPSQSLSRVQPLSSPGILPTPPALTAPSSVLSSPGIFANPPSQSPDIKQKATPNIFALPPSSPPIVGAPVQFKIQLPVSITPPKAQIRSIQTARPSIQLSQILETNNPENEKSKKLITLQLCLDNLNGRGGEGGKYLNLHTGNLVMLSTIKRYGNWFKDDTLLIAGPDRATFDFIKTVIYDYKIETPVIEGMADEIRITPKIRHEVWVEANGDSLVAPCFCCNNNTTFGLDYEAGHIKARAKGGHTDKYNLRPICRTCNRSMKTTDMRDYARNNNYLGRITLT